jgi:glycosyltransferase involved in cell wall biosynthesis
MLPNEVCFIAGTLGQGGAERQLYYILKSLQQRGVRVQVLCLTKGEFWEKRIRDLGITVSWVGRRGSKVVRLAHIIHCLRRWRPQVLQSQHVFTNLYAVAAARTLGLREVGALRNSGVREVWSNGKVIGQLNLRTPRSLVVNSQRAIRRAIDVGVPPANLHFLPNVVDSDHFVPATRPNKDEIKLLAVGRLVKEKRMDRFLRLVADLRRHSERQISATIVGAGPLREQLEQQVKELDFWPNTITLKDTVTDMRSVYQEADILVLTSDFEGTPNVVLEAMASGLPVVATRVGGLPEIIRHGETGYLVETDPLDGTTELLLSLINNFELRREVGMRARKYVESEHSIHRLPALLENLYTQALS